MNNKKRTLKFSLTLMLGALALVCMLILTSCLDLFPENFFSESNDEFSELVREYENLLRMIDQLYIGEFDALELHAEAMRALVMALDDDWSFYMTRDEFNDFVQRATNTYAGIGVEIFYNQDIGGMEIVRVHRGSPAELGGILPGDVIVYIDGIALRSLTILDVRSLLARPLGDYAEVVVFRDDSNVALTIMYAEIFIDPISYEIIQGDIGYVAISNFDASSGERFIEVVEELIDKGVEGFIFDVRLNSGGSVRELTTALDFLLPEGEIFIHVNRQGEERITFSDEYWLDMPAVVLVNRYSYSAAEYFAAMLSEYEYAITVGEQTTGKNRSQTTHLIPYGGALHISTGEYLTRNRVSLGAIGGFTPDYIIEHTDEELVLLIIGEMDKNDDPQMQKAIAVLRELMR